MNGSPIKIISASAGSGKTYRLTQELLNSINSGVAPEKILATTFTNKAAAELIEKVRGKLFENGRPEEAQRILDGYLGTVNSVCGRLLKEFAFQCGLSPVQDVLPETEVGFIFNKAISTVVEKYSSEIEPIARRFGMKERDPNEESFISNAGYGFGGEDWRESIRTIIDLARNNNISADDLKKNAPKSLCSLKNIVGDPRKNLSSSLLDTELTKAIHQAYQAIKNNGDSTKGTNGVLKKLESYIRTGAKAEFFSWHDWEELSSKLSPCKASQADYEPVRQAAQKYLVHPRFHEDIETFINVIFNCANEAIEGFQEFKKNNGLVDFVDQEARTLEFLQNPENQKLVSEKFELLLVDEFQDTSPIQLALFLKFASLATKSIWVGDQKQSIYGFRGTDPALMDRAIDHLTGTNPVDILSDSWRSRESLLAFSNALFQEAFASLNISFDRVALNHKIDDLPDQEIPLHVWRLAKTNQDTEAQSLASGVKDLTQSLANFKVKDKHTKQERNLSLSDIAILCRTTEGKKRVAKALEEAGVRVTMPRDGLLSTPESLLGFAALRYLVDKNDTLALAELLHFTENPSGTPKWFTDWLALNQPSTGPKSDIRARLDALRPDLINWSPSEAMQVALNSIGIYEAALRWGDGVHRLSNVEKLRGLALQYESQSLVNRIPATPAGLVTFLYQKVLGSDLDVRPEGRDENAVQILTYHGAKGLEWPMVIMFELDKIYEPKLFGPSLGADMSNFDVTDPLKDRWIRYWPWPFGNYQKVEVLDPKIKNSPEYSEAKDKELKEAIRLMYVGMTRARDYLIFAVGAKPEKDTGVLGNSSTKWLDVLTDQQNKKLLNLPQDIQKEQFVGGKKSFQSKVKEFSTSQNLASLHQEFANISCPVANVDHLPLRLVPSQMSSGSGPLKVSIKNQFSLGDRVQLTQRVDMEMLGDAIHSFLAIDDCTWDNLRREEMAFQILNNWKIGALDAPSLIKMSDRLRSFMKNKFGNDSTWRREWPIHLKKENQKAKGWIDLLVETPLGYVIIDHKSFPGNETQCQAKILDYGLQLAIYKEAIEKATRGTVLSTMIHLPILGKIYEISLV